MLITILVREQSIPVNMYLILILFWLGTAFALTSVPLTSLTVPLVLAQAHQALGFMALLYHSNRNLGQWPSFTKAYFCALDPDCLYGQCSKNVLITESHFAKLHSARVICPVCMSQAVSVEHVL